MRAITNALTTFKDRFRKGDRIDITVDNTSVAFALRKGLAKACRLNDELRAVIAVIVHLGVAIPHVRYIRSADNRADYWSRLFTNEGYTCATGSWDARSGGGG